MSTLSSFTPEEMEKIRAAPNPFSNEKYTIAIRGSSGGVLMTSGTEIPFDPDSLRMLIRALITTLDLVEKNPATDCHMNCGPRTLHFACQICGKVTADSFRCDDHQFTGFEAS